MSAHDRRAAHGDPLWAEGLGGRHADWAVGDVALSSVFRGRQPAAVDSAFAILEAVASLGPGVTARQLVDSLEMPRATTYRLLKHLVQHDYLVRCPDLTGFALGRRVRDLARAADGRREEVES